MSLKGRQRRGIRARIPVLGSLMEKRRVTALSDAAVKGDPDAVTALVEVYLAADDSAAFRLSATTLGALPKGPARDRFCREALLAPGPVLFEIANRSAYLPENTADRALFTYLRGDGIPDPLLIRAGFSRAPPRVREITLDFACRHGDAMTFAAVGPDRLDIALDDKEWSLLIGSLAREGRKSELWRLALEVGPHASAEIITLLVASGWQPGRDERQTWTEVTTSIPDRDIAVQSENSADTIEGGAGWVGPMAATPDGNYLLSGGGDGTIRCWRLPDGELVETHRGAGGNVTDIACTKNGTLFAAGSSRGPILISSPGQRTGQPIRLQGHEGGTRCLEFSADGKLYSGGYDGTLSAWDPLDGHKILQREAHKGELLCLAISPDGHTIASGGTDGIVRTWSLPGLGPDRYSRGHTDWVRVLQWLPDGRTLASAGNDGTIRLWSCERCVRVLRGHEDAVRSLVPVPGGLVSGGDRGSLHLWQLPEGKPMVQRSGHRGAVTRLVTVDSGNSVLSAGADGILRLWTTGSLDLVRTMKGHSAEVRSLLVTPGETVAASGSWDGTIRLWTLPDGLLVRALQPQPRSIVSLCVIPNGGTVAAGLSDGTIRMLAVPDGSHVGVVEGHTGDVSALSVSPDGRLIASAGSDGCIRVLLMPGTAIVHEIWGHEGRVSSLAFSPDGTLLASGGWDEDIRLWRLADRALQDRVVLHKSIVTSLAFTPDGRYLASGSNDTTVRLWNISERREQGAPRKHGAVVTCLAITPDGSLLASGGWDRRVRFWTIPDGTAAGEIGGLPGRVTSLAITQDGRLIAIGCDEGKVFLRELPGGRKPVGQMSIQKAVTSLAVTADGRSLAIASEDGSIRFWHLPWTRSLSSGTPEDLEYAQEMCRRFPGSGKGGWHFVNALLKGALRTCIEYAEPVAPAGEYDIEFGY